MPEIIYQVTLPTSPTTAFAWHARPGALQRLAPPWRPVAIRSFQPAPGAHSIIENGGRLTLDIAGVPWAWRAEHRDYHHNESFTDVQLHGPFAEWTHVHRFEESNGHCRLSDCLSYRHGLATSLIKGRIVRDLERLFAFRHHRTRWDIERHASANVSPQSIAITGASGLVGSALIPFLTTGGHSVRTIGRGQADIRWDPAKRSLDPQALNGVDTVIHLAGENVAQRWTPAAKERIRQSRINSTAFLAFTLASLPQPPRVLIVPSGIGYYGTHVDDQERDESAEAGDGFLAEVCQEWEAAAETARQAGIRVVHLRIGMVLSAAGGALRKMLPAFRCGFGGRIGSGKQWQSWIHLDDLLDIILRAMADEDLSGAINVVAPQSVRQWEFAHTLGQHLHRPTLAPLPAWVVSTLFGRMGTNLLTEGTRVTPARLLAAHHRWRYPTLDEALRYEL
jgi:uncharacterized protein (TIGR01777 family)